MSDLVNFFGNPDGFDTHSVEPQKDFTVIPPGKYPVEVESAAMVATKKKDGHYLEIVLKILDGPDDVKGRKVWDRLNLDNPSQIAREIALRSFAGLGQALGLARIKQTEDIVGGKCIACVKVKGDNNEVRAYEPLPVTQFTAPGAVALPPAAAALAAPVALVAPSALHPPVQQLSSVQQPVIAPVAVPAQQPVQQSVVPAPAPTAPMAAPAATARVPVQQLTPAQIADPSLVPGPVPGRPWEK